MEEIPAQLDLSAAEYSERLLLLLLRQEAGFQAAYRYALAHREPLLVGTPGYLVEVFREVERLEEVGRVALDELVVEQLLEDLSDD